MLNFIKVCFHKFSLLVSGRPDPHSPKSGTSWRWVIPRWLSLLYPLTSPHKSSDKMTFVLEISFLSTLFFTFSPFFLFSPFSWPHPAFIGFETNNQYEIKNSLGQKIFKAKEKNDCCTRNCCGSLRSFDMKIKDNSDREVIRLIRPFRCVSCWCPCCLQEVCMCGFNGSGHIKTTPWSYWLL